MTDHPLAQWLHQQLDHEELLARAARPGPWKRNYHGAFMHNVEAADGQALIIEGLMGTEDVAHVITHNPIRVLREIESKRRMIDKLWGGPDHEDMWLHHLKLLAIPYQDRPGYQEAIRGQL